MKNNNGWVLLEALNQYNNLPDAFWFDLAEQSCRAAALDVSNEALAKVVEDTGLLGVGLTEFDAIIFLRKMIGAACPEHSA